MANTNENKTGKWILVNGNEETPEQGIAYARQATINGEEFIEVVEVTVHKRGGKDFVAVQNVTGHIPDLLEYDECESAFINHPKHKEKYGYEVIWRCWDNELINESSGLIEQSDLETIKMALSDFLAR